MPRIASLFFAGMLCLIASMLLVAVWQSGSPASLFADRGDVAQVAQLSKESGTTHPIIIRQPSGPPQIELTGTDPQGRTGSVACSTCHSVRKPNLENKTAATLDEFHQGMTFNHGNIACYACHNPDESDALRLADGSSVAYASVMTLCSQCHSSQAESFAHGAHGGMNGYWDLSRGPQMKNNCVDCHDPHAPSYPKMIVGFKPKDRFNEPSTDDHDAAGAYSHDNH